MRWSFLDGERTTAAAPSGGAAPPTQDPRRAPRMAVRCRVVVRGRASSWSAETEDLGPGGCQLVTPRYEDAGPEIALSIASPLVPRPLVSAGRVVWWAEASARTRLGVAFAGGGTAPGAIAPADWFARVFAGTPGATVRDGVRSVAAGAVLYLAPPPARLPALGREHVRLLRAVGGGAPVESLRAIVGAAGFEPALFALLSHRCLTLARAAAAPPAAWARAIDAAEQALARAEIARARPAAVAPPAQAAPPVAPVGAVRRSPAAQRLYERGVELLVAGNAEQAEHLFRAASAAAPGDAVLRGVLARFG